MYILRIFSTEIHRKKEIDKRNFRSLSFPVAPTLEQRASVKRFVSLYFINPMTVGRIPWTADQPVAMLPPTQDNTKTQNKLTQTSVPSVGFEPTMPKFE
jgi:hypothetical protein